MVSVAGFFHVRCFQGSSVLWQVSVHSFNGQIIFHRMDRPRFVYLSAHRYLVASAFCLLWIMLPWTLACVLSSEHTCSFLSGIYLGANNWDVAISRLPFGGPATPFFKRHFIFLPRLYEGSNFSIASPTLMICLFRHPSRYKVVFHRGFDFHSPNG